MFELYFSKKKQVKEKSFFLPTDHYLAISQSCNLAILQSRYLAISLSRYLAISLSVFQFGEFFLFSGARLLVPRFVAVDFIFFRIDNAHFIFGA